MSETELIQPLTAEEIQSGIVEKVCESLWEAMTKTCNLYGVSYPKFSAKGTIDCVFDNFGQDINDRIQFSVEIDIPHTPPNVFRRQTSQAVPVAVEREDGSVEQKAVIYKRPVGRPRKLGRADGTE